MNHTQHYILKFYLNLQINAAKDIKIVSFTWLLYTGTVRTTFVIIQHCSIYTVYIVFTYLKPKWTDFYVYISFINNYRTFKILQQLLSKLALLLNVSLMSLSILYQLSLFKLKLLVHFICTLTVIIFCNFHDE